MLQSWKVQELEKTAKIFPEAQLFPIPQDLKFNGEESVVEIGNETTMRECSTINRGTSITGKTLIGENCLIMAYSHAGCDCVIGNNCIIVNGVALAYVKVGDYAIIGGNSSVHQFVTIGKHTMISGGSLVRKDVPPYVKAC